MEKGLLMGYYRDYPDLLWQDIIKPALLVVVTVAIVWLIGLMGYNFALDNAREACGKYGKQTAYEVEYRNLSWGTWECFVNVNGQWIPDQQVRIVGGND